MSNLAKRKLSTLTAFLIALPAGSVLATPSTQIWIPSTDIQAYKSVHLGIDNYLRESADDGGARPHVFDIGLTTGVLPYQAIQMEVGFDVITNGTGADSDPLYFNAKLGTPEATLFSGAPALALGGFGFGTKSDATDVNIVYGLAAKTFPMIGRLSAGYYMGNDELLVDANGNKDEDGVLLSWDRPLSEISDKLWAAIDYQGGDNAFGAVSYGFSWAFAENVSVIFGYDDYNEKATGGENTITTQLDINF